MLKRSTIGNHQGDYQASGFHNFKTDIVNLFLEFQPWEISPTLYCRQCLADMLTLVAYYHATPVWLPLF